MKFLIRYLCSFLQRWLCRFLCGFNNQTHLLKTEFALPYFQRGMFDDLVRRSGIEFIYSVSWLGSSLKFPSPIHSSFLSIGFPGKERRACVSALGFWLFSSFLWNFLCHRPSKNSKGKCTSIDKETLYWISDIRSTWWVAAHIYSGIRSSIPYLLIFYLYVHLCYSNNFILFFTSL